MYAFRGKLSHAVASPLVILCRIAQQLGKTVYYLDIHLYMRSIWCWVLDNYVISYHKIYFLLI